MMRIGQTATRGHDAVTDGQLLTRPPGHLDRVGLFEGRSGHGEGGLQWSRPGLEQGRNPGEAGIDEKTARGIQSHGGQLRRQG